MPYVSPKTLASAAGVSESSIKRWCDQGVIATEKTAGGHRRITLASATEYLRKMGRPVAPQLIGLPLRSHEASSATSDMSQQFLNAIVLGDEEACRQIIFQSHLTGESASRIFDEIITPAFRCIGTGWECDEVEIYQERRACGTCLRIIGEWQQRIPSSPANAPLAIGGSVESDPYSLPTAMVETVLQQLGWRSKSLGSRLPFETLIAAVRDLKPDLLWLSVSHLDDEQQFLDGYRSFYQAIDGIVPIVIGGRALTEHVRQRIHYTCFCDNLQHLESFTNTLIRSHRQRLSRRALTPINVSTVPKKARRKETRNDSTNDH